MAKGRGRRRVGANIVSISSRERTLSSVKARTHGLHGGNPAVAGKEGVESARERSRRPSLRRGEADGQAFSVHARIGTPRRVGHAPAAEEAFQDMLEFALDRSAGGLALPPDKPGAVE